MVMNHNSSQAWFERAKKLIPGGVNSPVRAFRHVNQSPVYFESANGPFLYDVDGNQYVDFCMSFGPHLLGHSHPSIVNAIQKQAEKATSFGACHPKEVELGELILKSFPFFQKIRLMNSGTEAVMTAVRLARGYTGRSKIVVFEGCYHGHSDGLLAKAGSGVAELAESSSEGVPKSVVADTLIAHWDDFDGFRTLFEKNKNEIAAFLLEPIPANYGLKIPKYEFIKEVVHFAQSQGALVIFDEVISGFRVGLGGASHFFDLKPDLITLGKVVGGGLPLAAVVGRGEVMDHLAPQGKVYQAGTLSGNPLGCAAGIAALTALWEHKPDWKKFEDRAEAFSSELEKIVQSRGEASVGKLGSIFWLKFGPQSGEFPPDLNSSHKENYLKFFQMSLDHGIYLPPSPYEVGFLSFAHTDEVLSGVLEKWRQGIRKI
jgi:glutamate-1-semialdehyde 2,1-aminomutase